MIPFDPEGVYEDVLDSEPQGSSGVPNATRF